MYPSMVSQCMMLIMSMHAIAIISHVPYPMKLCPGILLSQLEILFRSQTYFESNCVLRKVISSLQGSKSDC